MRISSCYRNLHKNCISVKTGTNPVRHVDRIELTNVRFHVNQNGRDRVLQEKRKNVHAYVKGYPEESQLLDETEWISVSYNPYKQSSFYRKDTGEPVKRADRAIVTTKGVLAFNPS